MRTSTSTTYVLAGAAVGIASLFYLAKRRNVDVTARGSLSTWSYGLQIVGEGFHRARSRAAPFRLRARESRTKKTRAGVAHRPARFSLAPAAGRAPSG